MAAFEASRDELAAEGIAVIAASTDDVDHASGTASALSLGFPVGYGLDREAVAAITGAYHEPRRNILHATGFVVRPDATVGVACYSTGPIGRLTPEDVLGLVRFWKSR